MINRICAVKFSCDSAHLRFWDMRQSTPMSSLDLSERVYCADVVYPAGVVGCAGRQIIVYTLEKGPEVAAQIESPLSFQVFFTYFLVYSTKLVCIVLSTSSILLRQVYYLQTYIRLSVYSNKSKRVYLGFMHIPYEICLSKI